MSAAGWQTVSGGPGGGGWQTVSGGPQPQAKKAAPAKAAPKLNPLISGATNLLRGVGASVLSLPSQAEDAADYLSGGLPEKNSILRRLATPPPGVMGTIGYYAAPVATAVVNPLGDESLLSKIPTKGKAAKLFNLVEEKVGGNPVAMDEPYAAARRAEELGKTGATTPKVVNDTLRFVDNPEVAGQRMQSPWQTARDFYSNANEMSTEEKMGTKPRMRRQVVGLARAYDKALRDTAAESGAGEDYDKAIKTYRRAAKLRKVATAAGKGLGFAALGALGYRELMAALAGMAR